jgi:16S rRNA processing protein RimM
LKRVTLRLKGTEKNYEVEAIGGAAASFVMKFVGVDTPEAAKPLAGAELVAPREGAAPLAEDEYYIEDLRGLSVILGATGSGDAESAGAETVGELTDVLEGGGGQLAEIRLKDGSHRLVPFRNEFFGEIDLVKRTVVLRERWMLE